MNDVTASRYWLDVWLGRLPGLVAAASVSTLVLTIIHELGYFYVVGLRYWFLLTTTDFFTAALFWLPITLLSGLFTAIIGYFVYARARRDRRRALRPRERPENVTPFARVKLIILYRYLNRHNRFPLLFSLSFLVPLIAYVMVGDSIGFLIGLFVILLAALLQAITDLSTLAARWANRGFMIIGVSAMIFGIGERNATKDFTSFASVYRLALKPDRTTRWVVLLRSIDKGVLIHDPVNNRVEFVKWSDVDSISNVASSTLPFHRFTCRLFRLHCPDTSMVP